jgi:hypothetical protein
MPGGIPFLFARGKPQIDCRWRTRKKAQHFSMLGFF